MSPDEAEAIVACHPKDTVCSIMSCHSIILSFAPGDAYYLAIGGGVAEHNWNHIRTVLQDEGFRCQLVDHSEDMGMISIQGPKRWGKKGRREGEGGREGGYEWEETLPWFICPGEKRTKGVSEGKERWRGEGEKKKVTDWSKDGLWFTSWTREFGKLKRRAVRSIRGEQVILKTWPWA